MTKTNSAIAGGGKAVEAHLRNQSRPEEAQHFDLKDEPGERGEAPADDSQPLDDLKA